MHKPFISKPVKPWNWKTTFKHFCLFLMLLKSKKFFHIVDMINKIMKVKFVKNKQNIPSRKLKCKF